MGSHRLNRHFIAQNANTFADKCRSKLKEFELQEEAEQERIRREELAKQARRNVLAAKKNNLISEKSKLGLFHGQRKREIDRRL
ncbi:hypothetical protein FACS189490_09830 [Clostridia bacterium]|nr:hypothetical protein FACS189490_09830 [Clostridia bacterium]